MNVRSVNEKRIPTLKKNYDDLRQVTSAPGQKKLALKTISRKTAEIDVSIICFTAWGYWNEGRLIKPLAFLECVVNLFEETINRCVTKYKIPNFTILREMGHLRHQTSIVNPCKILFLQ